jgi:hypothetical protein
VLSAKLSAADYDERNAMSQNLGKGAQGLREQQSAGLSIRTITSAVAQIIPARLMTPLSSPLTNCVVECNRKLHRLQVGDPLKITWGPLGIERLVMRVTSVDLGTIDKGSIRLGLIQDVFGTTSSVYTPIVRSDEAKCSLSLALFLIFAFSRHLSRFLMALNTVAHCCRCTRPLHPPQGFRFGELGSYLQ